jgi:hypothetical protein
MWEGAFQWGLCGFTLYIIGVSQALAEVSFFSVKAKWIKQYDIGFLNYLWLSSRVIGLFQIAGCHLHLL